MALTPLILAVAAAYPRDLYLAPAPVQQPFQPMAMAQPAVYSYAAPAPAYVAYESAPAAGMSAGSALFVVAAAAAGAAVGVAMNNQKQAALAVEGRAASRRAVLAAAALAPLAANAAVDGVNSGLADNSTSRFNNAVLGVQSNTDFTAGNEDSIAAIAAKNAAKLAEEKANKNKKYTKTEEDIERDAENSKKLVLGIAGAGTVLSGAFIIPNLTRLATKIAP